jgi:uncharacterized protein (TIGR03067 family)
MSRHALWAVGLGLLLAGVGTAAAGDAKEEAVKKDRKKYEGTWQAVSLTADGNEASEEDVKKITVVNEADGKWAVQVEGKFVARGTSKIDPTKEPKEIDLTTTEGEGEGKTARGIYEVGEDDRKVCFAPPGKERPAEFASRLGTGNIFVVFKRVKK